MDRRLEKKLERLRERIRKLDSALVSFSGNVDSSFLMRICRDELGEKAVAVTALDEDYPRSELGLARRVARIIGVKHIVFDPQNEKSGRPSRFGGKNVYSSLKCIAMRLKLRHVINPSHADDAEEREKRFLAAREAGVKSPLLECNLTKAEIRLLAKEFGLPTYERLPSCARKTSSETKGKSKGNAKNLLARYARSLGSGVRLITRGKKAFIRASKSRLGILNKRLPKIQKKLESFGFSKVALEVEKS